jgi:hypothetical protein
MNRRVSSAVVCILLVGSVWGKVDKTRDAKVTGPAVVDAVVDMISESCVFDDDALFLRRIATVATMDGISMQTFMRNSTHYSGGIWQVSTALQFQLKLTHIFIPAGRQRCF